MSFQLTVDVNTEPLAGMVARAVAVPDNRERMAMIQYSVETEVIPFALWQQGIDLDGVIRARAQATKTCNNQVVPCRVVVITAALLVALQPIARRLVEVFANVGLTAHVLTLHIFLKFSEVEGVDI